MKRRRSVTLRVSSTNRCAAYGRIVPGAFGDQPRPRSAGPSGQAVTKTGISRTKVVSPKGRSASRCSRCVQPCGPRRPCAGAGRMRGAAEADGRFARHKADSGAPQAERRQGREAAGGAARSEAERGWSTVRKGACRQARKCIAGMRPPEGTGTGKCHRQKMILFCRLGTRYREPAACDHRRDSRATYPLHLPERRRRRTEQRATGSRAADAIPIKQNRRAALRSRGER